VPGGQPSRRAQPAGACIAHGDGDGTHIGAYASFDAGATWHSLGGLQDSANGRDPTVTFGASGRGYVCANTDDLHVWRTDDGGRTFSAPVLATRGHKLDHPWLAADPSSGPPSTTHLYGVWTGSDNTHLEFGRSTDGGRSFQAPLVIDTVQGPNEANFASPMIAAGPGGTIHAIYGVWPPLPAALPRPEFPAPIRVISSPTAVRPGPGRSNWEPGRWRSGYVSSSAALIACSRRSARVGSPSQWRNLIFARYLESRGHRKGARVPDRGSLVLGWQSGQLAKV
jgi:hypothetical protein